MAKGLTPQETADKQIKNAKAAVSAFIRGAQGVTEAPNAKAAKAQDKYLANVQAAVDDGTYRDNNNAVGLAPWQDAMVNKGAKNYPTGIDYAKDKIAAFHNQFDPYRDSVAKAVNAMPNDTESERDAKMLENAKRLRQFKFKKGRGA